MSEFSILKEAYDAGGWLAMSAAVVVVLIRLFRRPEVQGLIPSSRRWEAWPFYVRVAVVFLAAFLTSLVGSLVGGATVKAALLAAVPVAIAAIGTHKITKAIGHTQTNAALKSNPVYRPGKARMAADLVLPIDHDALAIRTKIDISEVLEREQKHRDLG